MYTISEASERSDMSSYTIRYYEKIGLLPSPKRTNGERRQYTEGDIQFMIFLRRLKRTGMTLENIQEFVRDGCILEKIHSKVVEALNPSITKRIAILTKHLEDMEQQKAELEKVMITTKEKLDIYYAILNGDWNGEEL